MATRATLTAPFHVDYSGSAHLCTSAGLVWFDESDCSSPKSDHIIIVTQDPQGSIAGLLTKPTPSTTETVTLTSTTKLPETATVSTTLPKPFTQATTTVTIPETTIAMEPGAARPRALETPLWFLETLHATTATLEGPDGQYVIDVKKAAGNSLKPRRSVSAVAAILFALACLMPTVSAMPIEETITHDSLISEQTPTQARDDLKGSVESLFALTATAVYREGSEPQCAKTQVTCNTDHSQCTQTSELPNGVNGIVTFTCDGQGDNVMCYASLRAGITTNCDGTLEHCTYTDSWGGTMQADCDKNEKKCKYELDGAAKGSLETCWEPPP